MTNTSPLFCYMSTRNLSQNPDFTHSFVLSPRDSTWYGGLLGQQGLPPPMLHLLRNSSDEVRPTQLVNRVSWLLANWRSSFLSHAEGGAANARGWVRIFHPTRRCRKAEKCLPIQKVAIFKSVPVLTFNLRSWHSVSPPWVLNLAVALTQHPLAYHT